MITELISRIVILLVGVLYPAYCSFKAVKYKDHRQYTTWMMYWIVFALFLSLETFSDVFISWLPFYYEIKIVIVMWLALPCTEGAKHLYRRLLHTQLMDREEQIDDLLSHVGKSGLGIFRKLYTLLVNHASTGIVQAAMKLTGGQDQAPAYNGPEEPMIVRETHLHGNPDISPSNEGAMGGVTIDTQSNEYKKTF